MEAPTEADLCAIESGLGTCVEGEGGGVGVIDESFDSFSPPQLSTKRRASETFRDVLEKALQ